MTPYLASSRHRSRVAVTVFSLAVVLVMILSACGGGNNSPNQTTRATTLRVNSSPAQTHPDLFSPFMNANQGSVWGTQGLINESLYFTNLITGESQGWLATSSNYSTDLSQITFHLRPGVKWNDNQPLTSADVAYTFQLLQKYSGLDANGVMPIVKSWTTPDSSTITFTLKQPDSTALYRIGSQVFIVPQHVWSTVSDPTKFPNDKNPVGTGPYLLSHYDPNLITYKVNPSYWGQKPAVQTIQAFATKDNTTAITNMSQGQYDWTSIGWNPNYDASFGNKDPQHNHTWFTASNTVMLYLNLTKAPFNKLPVRQAISAAINRDNLPQGLALYAKVANPTGVITPTLKDWISSQYQSSTFQYSTSQAASYLQQAGYSKGSDGFYRDASGKELTMTVGAVNGWSDFDQDVQNIVSDLKGAGINATANTQKDYAAFYDAFSKGNYDAAIYGTLAGPTPYFAYQPLLSSAYATPVGSVALGSNYERWNAQTSSGLSTQTDNLLKQYESTTDVNVQKQAIAGIEDIMVKQLPAIPLTVNPYWMEFSTLHWTGFPDQSNPYDAGPAYQMPDAENVILHLKPAA